MTVLYSGMILFLKKIFPIVDFHIFSFTATASEEYCYKKNKYIIYFTIATILSRH